LLKRGIKMKDFEIRKNFIIEDNIEKLSIYVVHNLNKDQWKNRLLLFNSESAVYKKEKEKQKWQKH
jgi:hypothetical protein